MDLPVMPPVKPMLAKAVKAVPDQPDDGPAWLYEPKWDGFRCLVFRDGDEVVLGSRNERPLTRYFPEVVAAVKAELPRRCVVDGELVVARPRPDGSGDKLDWDSLSQRIHPAESRINKLAAETPASYVAFDVLALDDESLLGRPLRERRERLVAALGDGPADRRCHVTATTTDADLAREWFSTFEGAGLDGVLAKRLDGTYQPDVRALFKVKHHRTADCVVIGYRPHKSLPGIGSMLLGLYAGAGDEGWGIDLWGEAGHGLKMVGAIGAFTQVRRRELLEELQPYRIGDGAMRAPGEKNRWNQRVDNSWVPLRPELVVEVEYDQMEGDRFRHAARFLRWRTDRDPGSCTYDQLEVPTVYDLEKVLST